MAGKPAVKPYMFALLAVLFWSTTAAVAKLLLSTMVVIQVLLFTSLFATITLFAVALLQNKTKIIRKYAAKDFLRFAYMGFIGIFLYYVFLYAGLATAPAQEAFVVNYTWPIWVVIFAIPLLHEGLCPEKIMGTVLGFTGVAYVVIKGDVLGFSILSSEGGMFAIAGAVCCGLFSVLGKKQDYDRITPHGSTAASAFCSLSSQFCPFLKSSNWPPEKSPAFCG
ncbi:MAG: DMT family transporter [Candidatus Micrarchaeota archaeon]